VCIAFERSGSLRLSLRSTCSMSDIEAEIRATMTETPGDAMMIGDEDVMGIENSANALNGENGGNGFPFHDEEEEVPAKITYIDYLKSPSVELLVGEGEDRTVLSAHQALLVQSPFFEDACAQFSDNVVVGAT
jgi:hypothetical protein